MNTDTILRLLQNAGFYEVRADSNFVYMEDPSCILRGFETFIEYMWIIITIITGILLFGMAVSIIRGAKYSSAFTNLRNLLLIFGALSAVYPIMNVLYNGDLFATGCKTFSIPIAEINKMLDLKNEKFGKYNYKMYFCTVKLFRIAVRTICRQKDLISLLLTNISGNSSVAFCNGRILFIGCLIL